MLRVGGQKGRKVGGEEGQRILGWESWRVGGWAIRRVERKVGRRCREGNRWWDVMREIGRAHV